MVRHGRRGKAHVWSVFQPGRLSRLPQVQTFNQGIDRLHSFSSGETRQTSSTVMPLSRDHRWPVARTGEYRGDRTCLHAGCAQALGEHRPLCPGARFSRTASRSANSGFSAPTRKRRTRPCCSSCCSRNSRCPFRFIRTTPSRSRSGWRTARPRPGTFCPQRPRPRLPSG